MAEDLVNEIRPKDISKMVARGWDRLAPFRAMRKKSIQQYVGPHYGSMGAGVGSQPLNLLFNAISVILPSLVTSFPQHNVSSPYLQDKQYADLLALALSFQDKKLNIQDIYQRATVEAFFGLGIMKTGVANAMADLESDEANDLAMGDVFTEPVSLDDFVADPESREHLFSDARFIGHRLIVPRKSLLESDLYDEDEINALPKWGDSNEAKDETYQLSRRNTAESEQGSELDDVAIVELWIPSSNVVITLPGDEKVHIRKFLRIDDFYGVKEGPYTLLSFSPPVPDNPMPVPRASVLYDCGLLANRMMSKIVDQAVRQKSIGYYQRAAVDDAKEVLNAADGEMVGLDNTASVGSLNLGGQVPSNEDAVSLLTNWFNALAGNTELLGGVQVQAKSATASNVLQQNSNIVLGRSKDLVYLAGAQEARRRAFYLHTDPLINMPLIQRQKLPSQITQGPTGPMLVSSAEQQVQVMLTPEQRSGDFLDFHFQIEPDSLSRMDSQQRVQLSMTFATQVLPAVVAAAQQAQLAGIGLNASALLISLGKSMGLTDFLPDVFMDQAYQLQQSMHAQLGPQDPGKASARPTAAILQNGQPGQVQGAPAGPPTPPQTAQRGANEVQALQRIELRRALSARPSNAAFSGV